LRFLLSIIAKPLWKYYGCCEYKYEFIKNINILKVAACFFNKNRIHKIKTGFIKTGNAFLPFYFFDGPLKSRIGRIRIDILHKMKYYYNTLRIHNKFIVKYKTNQAERFGV